MPEAIAAGVVVLLWAVLVPLLLPTPGLLSIWTVGLGIVLWHDVVRGGGC